MNFLHLIKPRFIPLLFVTISIRVVMQSLFAVGLKLDWAKGVGGLVDLLSQGCNKLRNRILVQN